MADEYTIRLTAMTTFVRSIGVRLVEWADRRLTPVEDIVAGMQRAGWIEPMTKLKFRVEDSPVPKGSFAGVWSERAGKVIMKNNDPRTKAFQTLVMDSAFVAMRNARVRDPFTGRIAVDATFVLGRRKSGEPWDHRPDVDKLLRTVLDGLTGVVYVDDKQVAVAKAEKCFVGDRLADALSMRRPGVYLDIEAW